MTLHFTACGQRSTSFRPSRCAQGDGEQEKREEGLDQERGHGDENLQVTGKPVHISAQLPLNRTIDRGYAMSTLYIVESIGLYLQ